MPNKHHESKYIKSLEKIQEEFNLTMATQITLKDLINEARSIPAFTGDDSYSLSSFIIEVETLLGMLTEESAKEYIYRILYSKIQGAAAAVIRRTETKSWQTVKKQLIKSFGVNEDYLDLKEEADQIVFKNVSQLYSNLVLILNKLNLKYLLDEAKPIEFKPSNNEKSILNKFLNKINRVDSMFIRTSKIETLEEAYQALVSTGITPKNDRDSNKFSNSFKPKQFSHSKDKFYTINHNYNPQYRVQNFNNNFNRNENRNFPSNSGNYQNNNFRTNNSYRSNNINSGRSRQFNNRYSNNPVPEPMEIEHNNAIPSENFHLPPPIRHYP